MRIFNDPEVLSVSSNAVNKVINKLLKMQRFHEYVPDAGIQKNAKSSR